MIGLVAATSLEAEGIIGCLHLHPAPPSPFPVYEGRDVRLIVSGVGKVNAAMAAAYLILRAPMKCVCNLGAAGATDDDRPLGACLHVRQVIEPDRLDFTSHKPKIHDLDTMEGFTTVSLATQDSPVVDGGHRRRLAPFADLLDMEGAAVTQTCHRLGVRCYVFKFVSDTPEHGEIGLIRDHVLHHRDAFARFFAREVRPRLA